MNSNQLIIRPEVGLITRIYSAFTVSGRHDSNAAANLVAGSPVKLANNTGTNGSIHVALAASTDDVYGVAGFFNPIHNSWAPGAPLEIALTGTHMYYPVSAAVTAGAKVAISINSSTGAVTVAPVTEAGAKYVGIAVTGNSAVGGFMEIVVNPGSIPAAPDPDPDPDPDPGP